jgi:DinB family protein
MEDEEPDMKRSKLETLLLTLESTPSLMAQAAAELSDEQARWKADENTFSLIENVWHLADLEREAYAVRIRRVLSEEEPMLSNFDGDRVARERVYNTRELAEGLAAFARARARNVEILRGLSRSEWRRRATQEGAGRISLEDVPRMMAEHDRSHTQDVRDLLAHIKDGRPLPGHGNSAVA